MAALVPRDRGHRADGGSSDAISPLGSRIPSPLRADGGSSQSSLVAEDGGEPTERTEVPLRATTRVAPNHLSLCNNQFDINWA